MNRRWLIYAPEIVKGTFVFFYFQGTTGRSWSVRDYSGDTVRVLYAQDFPSDWTPEHVLGIAERRARCALRRKGHGPLATGDSAPKQ